MEGHGTRISRFAAAADGWMPVVALAASAWLFYAATDLDAVSRPLAPAAVCDTAAGAPDAAAARPCGPEALTAQR